MALCAAASLVSSNLNGVALGFFVVELTMDFIVSIKLSGSSDVIGLVFGVVFERMGVVSDTSNQIFIGVRQLNKYFPPNINSCSAVELIFFVLSTYCICLAVIVVGLV